VVSVTDPQGRTLGFQDRSRNMNFANYTWEMRLTRENVRESDDSLLQKACTQASAFVFVSDSPSVRRELHSSNRVIQKRD
jgi:hypothetical protein